MAGIRVLTAVLEPEEAFQGTTAMVSTTWGDLHVVGKTLKLLSSAKHKDVGRGGGFMASLALLKAFLSTLAFITDIGVGHGYYDYLNLADLPVFRDTVVSERRAQQKVETSDFSSTQALLPLVISDLTLQRALEDYRTALSEPRHALIFLYRCIEWLKVRFDGWDEARKAIGSTKSEFRAIKEPANKYYLTRHALSGEPGLVPPQVRNDALKSTRKILEKYIEYLRSLATNEA